MFLPPLSGSVEEKNGHSYSFSHIQTKNGGGGEYLLSMGVRERTVNNSWKRVEEEEEGRKKGRRRQFHWQFMTTKENMETSWKREERIFFPSVFSSLYFFSHYHFLQQASKA